VELFLNFISIHLIVFKSWLKAETKKVEFSQKMIFKKEIQSIRHILLFLIKSSI